MKLSFGALLPLLHVIASCQGDIGAPGAPDPASGTGSTTTGVAGSGASTGAAASGGAAGHAGGAPGSGGAASGGGSGAAGTSGGNAAAGGNTAVGGSSGGNAAGGASGGSSGGGGVIPADGAASCAEVAPGAEVGDYVENFVLLSQTGEMVSLSNFCGKVVYVTMGAIWCSACTRWAQRLHIYAQKYPDDFVPIELLAESTHGQPGQPKDPPNAEELMAWAVEFQGPSPTAPVLADVGWEVYHRYFEGDPNLTGNVPQGLLIDREGRILSVGNVGFSNEVKDGDKIIDVTMYAIDEAVAAP